MLTYFMVFVAGAWVGSICMGMYAAFLVMRKSRGKDGIWGWRPERN